MIKRALISVYDKSGLDEFAQGLTELGAEIVSSGGTSSYLEEMGIPVTRIEEITQVPELLGGRVKTLHPRIHAAILARRDEPEDLSALEEQEIQPLDLPSQQPRRKVQVSGAADGQKLRETLDHGQDDDLHDRHKGSG